MEFDPKKIKLIIGLGNPDSEYKNTYHNTGFLFIDYLEKNPSVSSIKYQVLRSNEYMNKSGGFVAKAIKKIGSKPEEVLITHDDSDLEIGKYKIDFGRGAAGHHGIESIQQHLKTNDFWRLRIGIRPAGEVVRQKAEEFVLKKISAADMATLKKVFQEVGSKLSF
ncbi:MAG: peptidyl-tRNA hydrolase, PTH1 family [Parcubacteria group bacterium Gr01-1014_19]|nr:MAG: peptidyl-tRNA hydrolase, PTH1 family [Parcubacteria group bacterium Gr01-1014_19]